MNSIDEISRRKKETVIVIDDDDSFRSLIIRVLENEGYDVLGFAKGSDAIKSIAATMPAALLIDQNLPDVKGQDIITGLKEQGIIVPFIMMTGQGDEQLAVEMMKLGASDYWVKDISFIDILLVALERLFNVIATERTLRETRQKLDIIVDNIKDVVWSYDMDRDGNFISGYNSPAAAKMLGISEEEISNSFDVWFSYIYPEDLHRVIETMAEAIKTGTGQPIDYRLKKADGSTCWVRSIGNLVHNKDGTKSLVGTRVDITARKQMEEELRKSREELKTITDNMTDVVVLADKSAKRLYVSPSCKRAGYEPEELIEKNILDLVHPDDFPGVLEDFMKCIQDKKDIILEYRLRKKDGGYAWVEVSGKIFFDENNDFAGSVYTVRDIVDRKAAEEDLKEAHLQLQQEISKAEAIHKRVLPSVLPQTERVFLAGYNQPATQLGGDSYNAVRVGNKLVVYVSDVMGHSLDAAMLSVFIKEAIDSYITLKPEEISPQKIMNHLNNQYRRKNYPDYQLIAIFLAVLNLDTYEFIYSSAGFQIPPLVRYGDGEKGILEPHGLFISNCVPAEFLTFQETAIKLTPGTTIFISSDGLAEHDNGKDVFHNKYFDVFYDNCNFPPEIIMQALNKEFYYFNNNSPVGNDDITFLVLQYGNHIRKRKRIIINSEFEQLDGLYENIISFIEGFSNNSNAMFCLHELVVNAIEHGNKLDKYKTVTIDISVGPEDVFFEIEDEGDGFNWCQKLDKPVNMRPSEERGRGIAMTGLMCKWFFYNPKGNKASLLIKKRS